MYFLKKKKGNFLNFLDFFFKFNECCKINEFKKNYLIFKQNYFLNSSAKCKSSQQQQRHKSGHGIKTLCLNCLPSLQLSSSYFSQQAIGLRIEGRRQTLMVKRNNCNCNVISLFLIFFLLIVHKILLININGHAI